MGLPSLCSTSIKMEQSGRLCLCFPCILMYLDGFIVPNTEHQIYPELQRKGFSPAEQRAIAEEWYWIAVERETAIRDYLEGYVTFHDGCWWRPPPQTTISRRHALIFTNPVPQQPRSTTDESSPGSGPRT